ncbi:ras association domain-containing protein 8b isoform X1 [Gymnodraco acuticeps]|uniref:Ras association domain-containing protein 8b isoform X1 n=1 Tax=Gymnodraco acuticeps TaxID=8218 RepID=A0A6P8T065_GYMAC|nr:ras association domain-containing protein 8b isoform X1 [Gymnodraco acuticeps]
MKVMELKVWVDGVQRIVCGVTEFTTCQEVVIALAQAIGRTGRYTLIEKWRDTERHLAPNENPVVSLNKWGQYASDVQLILHRTGPSVSERPNSDRQTRFQERGFYRQSLPPLAKLWPSGNDSSLKRREPKRKSLTFTGGARGLRDLLWKSRDTEAKQPQQQRGVSLNLCRVGVVGGVGSPSVPGSPSGEMRRLVQLQRDKLQAVESRLLGCEADLRDWEEVAGEAGDGGSLEEELQILEQQVRRNEAEMEEEEFWQNELQIEQESEHQLRQQLSELQVRVRDCEAKLSEYLAHIQGMEGGLEQERLQQETELHQRVNEEEVQNQLQKVLLELEVQSEHTSRLESSCQALERSLSQSGHRLQEKEQELEQLTKELRQVNLQQFIQQTGTKVTVLPAQPAGDNEVNSGSLKRLGSSRLLPSDLRALSAGTSGLNPEGIYV